MFRSKHVEEASAVEGVSYATLLRNGQVLRVVFEHDAPTGAIRAVEEKLNLESGYLAATQDHLAAAEYRGFA